MPAYALSETLVLDRSRSACAAWLGAVTDGRMPLRRRRDGGTTRALAARRRLARRCRRADPPGACCSSSRWRRCGCSGSTPAAPGAAVLAVRAARSSRSRRGPSRNTASTAVRSPIASEGGVTFWTGNHPLAIGDGDLAANPDIKLRKPQFRARAPRPVTPKQLEPLYYREALAAHRGASRAGGSALEARKAVLHRRCRSARRTRCTRRGIASRRSASYC